MVLFLKNILWCITGAGAYLRDIVYAMLSFRERYGYRITICFSKWGFEVTRVYGLRSILEKIASGGYYEEWFIGDRGFYFIGRINMKKYDLVVIAPASSNTVAKIVNGIADTLPTLAFSQAFKTGIPIVIYPSDAPSSDGYVCSETPCYIDRGVCKCLVEGSKCFIIDLCPVKALVVINNAVRIDLEKCIGCCKCIDKCLYSAVKCWSRICIKPSEIDLRNIDYLSKLSKVYVVVTIDNLLKTMLNILSE